MRVLESLRGRARVFTAARVLAWTLLCTVGAIAPTRLQAELVNFDVPAQAADQALLTFSKQAQIEVLFASRELRRVRSRPVSGSQEPEAALSQLLLETGFEARRNSRGKFVITRLADPVGSIHGRLLTPDGRGAQDVRVTIPAAKRTTTTDADGEFSFPALPPGSYQVVATGAGFQPLHIKSARVTAQHALTLESHTLRSATDATHLEPVVVEGQASRREPFDRSATPYVPRTASGNIDLARTQNDALPYVIYDREQITRSGVVNLNEFLQRELLDTDAATRPPEQDGRANIFAAGSTNLNLRGFGADATVILVNGRRLPEALTSADESVPPPPDVNFIPLSLVQQIEVLPASASALYSGNAVGGVINIILRSEIDAAATEVTATYTNAVRGFDAPQSSVSLLHGQSLLGGALRVRLNVSATQSLPPTEAELGYRQARIQTPATLDEPLHRATPNVRSATDAPLFGPGTASVTSVAPGADGSGGLASFANRQGTRSLAFFDAAGGLSSSLNSIDFAYGRRQRRDAYFGSAVYDVFPWLQLGLDGTYVRTVANRGYDLVSAELSLGADAPLNPFGQDVLIALNETAPGLGENYGEARVDFSNVVAGALLKLPAEWRVSLDLQYGHNLAKYRGLAGADVARWQQLVDEGRYHPLRDTQLHAPPAEFYDRVLKYRGGRGRFVTLGDYDTWDAAIRVVNQALPLPTGLATLNLGADYRRNHLARYREEVRYGDGSLAETPTDWSGRTLERYSFFGELKTPLLPAKRLPRWLRGIESDLAVRYVAARTERESNVAPTFGLKLDFAGGLAMRGSVTTSSRFPTPFMTRRVAQPGGGGGGGIETVQINDPRRGETYGVVENELINPDLLSEEAVSQTAGLIYQRGEVHRLRVGVDFVDTRKTNEQVRLGPQELMNLESLFPERVQRAAPNNGAQIGRVITVFTGNTNLAWRHSQNWNTTLNYAWTECFGGTFEAYGRLLYFQRYDQQVLPDSPVVDQLSRPDGAASGLLRYRAKFGAGWSTPTYGVGLDGHYFHSRTLPTTERIAQGGSQIDPYWQFDAYVLGDLSRWLPWAGTRGGLRAQLRVNNVLGADFPKYTGEPTGSGVQPYGDWRGRVYSISVTATF